MTCFLYLVILFLMPKKKSSMVKIDDRDHRKNSRLVWTRRDFIKAGSGMALSATIPLGCSNGESTDQPTDGDDPRATGTLWAGTEKVMSPSGTLGVMDTG